MFDLTEHISRTSSGVQLQAHIYRLVSFDDTLKNLLIHYRSDRGEGDRSPTSTLHGHDRRRASNRGCRCSREADTAAQRTRRGPVHGARFDHVEFVLTTKWALFVWSLVCTLCICRSICGHAAAGSWVREEARRRCQGKDAAAAAVVVEDARSGSRKNIP